MSKKWQQVLIERLINQEYKLVGGEIELQNGLPFANAQEHEDWFYAKGDYDDSGLLIFDDDDSDLTQPGRKAIVNSTKGGHAGKKMPDNSAVNVDHTIGHMKVEDLYQDDKKDLFMAVRKKIAHVCDDCTALGAGTALYLVGHFYRDIISHVLAEYGNGNQALPKTKTEQHAAFEKMMKDTKLLSNIGSHKQAPGDEKKLKQTHAAAKGGGTVHQTW